MRRSLSVALALGAGACALPRRPLELRDVVPIEASAAGGSTATRTPLVAAECASQGRAVALDHAPGILALPAAAAGGELWLRLSCHGSAGKATLALEIDGRPAGELAIAGTLHRERFEWISTSWRPPAEDSAGTPGAERLLVVTKRGGDPVLLDQGVVLRARERPDPAASPRTWRSPDGALELRAAHGARVFDPEWILRLLREQVDVVAAMLGARLTRPVVLIAVPASRWPADRASALQNGCAILLRDDELHLPWRSYAHELVHLHEEELQQAGAPKLPWFLSEGIACAVALDVEERILGRAAVAAKHDELDRLLRDGDAWRKPGAASRNELFCDSEPSEPDRRAAAYAWATALVHEAAQAGSEEFWRRLHERLRAAGESDALGRAGAAALLEAAAGRPLGPLFLQVGLADEVGLSAGSPPPQVAE